MDKLSSALKYSFNFSRDEGELRPRKNRANLEFVFRVQKGDHWCPLIPVCRCVGI